MDQVLAHVSALKEQGNAHYARGRFERARECYTDAIAALCTLVDSDGADDAANTRTRRAQLYSNRAQTFIQERDFAQALRDATTALQHDPDNDKANIRVMVALENLERFEAALEHTDVVLARGRRQQQEQHTGAFEYALQARRRLRKLRQQDKTAAEKERAGVGRMVDQHQQLRINMSSGLPRAVHEDEVFMVPVNIGNEFGLFCRDYVKPNECIRLECVTQTPATTDAAPFSLKFHQQSDTKTDVTEGANVVTLNARGKATFEVAVISNKNTANCSAVVRTVSLRIQVHASSASQWRLLPVVSLPITVIDATKPSAAISDVAETLGVHCCRPVRNPSIAQEILLAESPGNLGIGGKLWDSCLVLTEYLAEHRDLLRDKRVIELGSGLGLVGICCALLGAADVTLTDMDEVVPLLAYNIKLNWTATCNEDMHSPRPKALALPWGSPIDSSSGLISPDVIVMSDVVYDPEGYAPLIASLVTLAPTPATTILMAHRSRNPMEHEFFALLDQQFDSTLLKVGYHPAAAATAPNSTGEAPPPWLQDIKLFHITRKSTPAKATV